MSDHPESRVSLSVGRALTVLFLFAFLGMYLWGIQLAYDNARLGITRALLFSLIIFGGGLSWDVLKEIARLPDERMKVFAEAMRKTLLWMFIYATCFVIGFKVLGEWAGLQTIGVLVYWLVSAWALYRFFFNFERAANAALIKSAAGAA